MEYISALKLAMKMHDDLPNRKNGEPYIMYPLAVANTFVDDTYASNGIMNIDTDCAIVAILHDTVETTELTIDSVERDYNPSDCIVDALIAITRKTGEQYLDYLLRCKRNKIAKKVKIEELLHNLRNLVAGKKRDRHVMALYILDI